MLVVHLIELSSLNGLEQMGEFNGDNSMRAEKCLQPANEIVEIRDLREYVVAQNQVWSVPKRSEFVRCAATEEFHNSRDAFFLSCFRDVCRRLNPDGGYAALQKVLEQIAVVACDLNDFAVRGQAELTNHLFDVCARVVEP